MVDGSDFPKGRRFLVTGANGFVGSHVVRALVRKGAVVDTVQRKSQGHVGIQGDEKSVVRVHFVDLTTGDLAKLFAKAQPEIVIHCAGLISAPQDENGRAALFAANVGATERVLHAAQSMVPSPKVVLVSSAAIWAPMTQGQSRLLETHPIKPMSVYGESKAEAARIGLAYLDQGRLDVTIGVPFNLIGPGQPSHLVPSVFIDQLKKNPLSVALRDPDAVRDWLDVRDVADALISLARPDVPPDLYNICSGQGCTVLDLLKRICRIANLQPAFQVLPAHGQHGVSRSVGDPSRLNAACGWQPKLSLDDTLVDMLT